MLVPRDLQNPSLNLPQTITIQETVQRNDVVFSVIGSDLDLSVSFRIDKLCILFKITNKHLFFSTGNSCMQTIPVNKYKIDVVMQFFNKT